MVMSSLLQMKSTVLPLLTPMLITSIALNINRVISSVSGNAYKSKNIAAIATKRNGHTQTIVAVVRERLVYRLVISLAIGETFMMITMMKMIDSDDDDDYDDDDVDYDDNDV